MPRSISQESMGPRPLPWDLSWAWKNSAISGVFTTTMPAMTSLWPQRYLVALWTTMSAPRSRGFWK